MAVCDAVIIFVTMLGIYGIAPYTEDDGIYALGTLIFTAVVILISIRMQILERYDKPVTVLSAIGFSMVSYTVWILILNGTYTDNDVYKVKGSLFQRFGQRALWRWRRFYEAAKQG